MYYDIPIAIDGTVLTGKAVAHGSGLGLGLAKTPSAKVTAVLVEAPFSHFELSESTIGSLPPTYGIDLRQSR